MNENINNIKYSIFDPTGNITALVETRVEAARQPAVADEIMKAHPRVEQVGFVYFEPGRPVPALLRMAGGEFCGNAAMSAAALYLLRSGEETDSVRVSVSGASRPIEVKLSRSEDGSFDAGVMMPPPRDISIRKLKSAASDAAMTVVDMEGISHIVTESFSELYSIKEDKEAAEELVKGWCADIGADCLGLMFLSGDDTSWELTPLVYVPGADTIFWENSCASGTAAVGMYMANKLEEAVDMTIKEPGGNMRVSSDPATRETILYGNTKLIYNE